MRMNAKYIKLLKKIVNGELMIKYWSYKQRD